VGLTGEEENAHCALSAIRRVTLENVLPPFSVPWMVPVAPVEEAISWDISEVVKELLAVYDPSVKPDGGLTVVAWTTPTA